MNARLFYGPRVKASPMVWGPGATPVIISQQVAGAGFPCWCFWAGRAGQKFTHRSDLWSCKLEIQMYNLGTYPNSFLGKVKSSAHSCTMRNVFYFCTRNCHGPTGEPEKQLTQSQNKAWLHLGTGVSFGLCGKGAGAHPVSQRVLEALFHSDFHSSPPQGH